MYLKEIHYLSSHGLAVKEYGLEVSAPTGQRSTQSSMVTCYKQV